MAISVALLIGDAQAWLPDLVNLAKNLKVGAILISYSGPVISPAAKDRILGLIESAEQEGGKIHLDGRHIKVSGYEHGNFVGPVIIEADTTMKCYEYVIFFPSSYVLYHEARHHQSRDFRARPCRSEGRHTRRGDPDHQQEPVRQRRGDLYPVRRNCT